MSWITFASRLVVAIRLTNNYYNFDKTVSICEWTNRFADILEKSVEIDIKAGI